MGLAYNTSILCKYRPVVLLLVVLLVLLSACGGSSGNTDRTSELEYGVPLESSSYLLYITGEGLNKISATTGESTLLHTFEGLDMIGPPDVIGETAFVTAEDNSMNAIDVNTGELLWDAPLGEYESRLAQPTPVVCDEAVCFAMGDTGLLYAIDTIRRRVKWQIALHPNGDSGEQLRGTALLVSGDKIYLGANRSEGSCCNPPVSPRLFVVDRESGALLQEVLYDFPLIGPPAISGDALIVSTFGGMQVLDRHELDVNWQVQGPAFTTALVFGESVIVSQVDRNTTYTADEFATVSFRLADGRLQWVVDGGSDSFVYTPTTDGQAVYTAINGRFICLECPNANALTVAPANGEVLREMSLSIAYTPLAAFGSLFYNDVFYDDGGDFDRLRGFVSIDAATGSLNWINTDSDLHSGSSGYVLVQNGVVHGRTPFPGVQN